MNSIEKCVKYKSFNLPFTTTFNIVNGQFSVETALVFRLPNNHYYVLFETNWAYLVFVCISIRQYFLTGTYYEHYKEYVKPYCIQMDENENNTTMYLTDVVDLNAKFIPEEWRQHAGLPLSPLLKIYD